MANRYVTITEVEKVDSLDTTDNVFVNNNGTLKQASINDILASTTIGTQVTALEGEVDELSSSLEGKSDTDHTHDGIYTTPAELNTAKNEVLQLANDYTDTVGNGKANINGWTPSRVMCSNSKGELVPNSSVTTNELGYLNGVTSNIQTQINTINDDLKRLHHLTVKSSAVKTFSFKINITSRGAFMMFGEVNAYPLLATGVIKPTDQTTNCTTNPFDGGTLTIDIQCTECDADGYSTVTVTFDRNIYGWIDILSSHPMLEA